MGESCQNADFDPKRLEWHLRVHFPNKSCVVLMLLVWGPDIG